MCAFAAIRLLSPRAFSRPKACAPPCVQYSTPFPLGQTSDFPSPEQHHVRVDGNYATSVVNLLCIEGVAAALDPSYNLLDESETLLTAHTVISHYLAVTCRRRCLQPLRATRCWPLAHPGLRMGLNLLLSESDSVEDGSETGIRGASGRQSDSKLTAPLPARQMLGRDNLAFCMALFAPILSAARSANAAWAGLSVSNHAFFRMLGVAT